SATKGTSPNGGKSTKTNRPAHVTTKGRAAETVKTRPTRNAPTAKNATTKRSGTASSPSDKTRSTKRTPAKASTRPASVERSVWTQLNDPRLGQVDGALSKTGSHDACVNAYGALDMVGNLHEWVKTDPSTPHGTFAGGYYLDTALNGDG